MLRLKSIKFRFKGKIIHHNSKSLTAADIVMITFEFQKNDWRSQTVHMFKTKDKLLNPVRAWALTVQRIRSTVKNFNDETKVCTFVMGNDEFLLTGDLVRTKLRAVVEIMGEATLGFSKDDIGLHSIRAGGAMAMFLSGVSEIIIQRIGRWSSFAFLEYIREQVECFTAGVSQKMLKFESFYHLNENEAHKEKAKRATTTQDIVGPESIAFNIRFSKMVLYDNNIKNRMV